MQLIAGLGNPTEEYAHTRHNMGFMVLDALAKEWGIAVSNYSKRAFLGSGIVAGQKVLLVKPQTYMNLSGVSIREIVSFYKIEKQQILIIYDDIHLPLGQLRIRKKGSAGGHNGMRNIIEQLGTDEISRIRMGVNEKPERMDLAEYVLGKFPKSEQQQLENAILDAVQACGFILEKGMEQAMNRYNQKQVDRIRG